MTLKFDEKGLVDRRLLNEQEREIFIAFLKSEKFRHEQDVEEITQDIIDMEWVE